MKIIVNTEWSGYPVQIEMRDDEITALALGKGELQPGGIRFALNKITDAIRKAQYAQREGRNAKDD